LTLRTVTLAWRDQISSSPSIVSTSTIWKRVSGNTCKNFITIQRLVQTLWPFELLLWPGATRPPPHRVLIPHYYKEKGPSETPVKFLSRSNDRFKRYGPYEPLLLPGAKGPPVHRVSIPHPLYGKRHPETPVKFRSRSKGRIKSYCLYEPLL